MNDAQLEAVRQWFTTYAQEYLAQASIVPPRRALMGLKLAHSRRVAAEARSLAVDLGWDRESQNTAEALGWLHDTGRFSQMAEFGTFRDAHSVNHAARGHEVLSQSGILRPFSERRQRQILEGILHHSALRIPADVHHDSLEFIRLIRDADKLDIFHIFIDAILHNHLGDYPDITHHVDLEGPPSPELISALRAGRVPGYRMVRSLNDWKLLQVSWVYDLAYVPTCRRVLERQIIETFAGLLPDTADIRALTNAAIDHLQKRTG